MPVFLQQQNNDSTRLGIWKIEETEEFFRANVPQHRDVTHPHKRLQHLAGRFLLQYLFPAFPYELIEIADTRKPYLPDEQYHFSISHCGDFAAAIISKSGRVGVDIEIPVDRISRIRDKFISKEEIVQFDAEDQRQLTLLWSSKEAVFKWYGNGGVDFRDHIHLYKNKEGKQEIDCVFTKNDPVNLNIEYILFDQIVLAWVVK
jgi:phosphopantetheinyl transferase